MMNLKKLLRFFSKNYFLSILILVIFSVVFIAVLRTVLSKPTYVYVRVKLGQGYWWASTVRPSMWYSNSLKKGDVATDLINKPTASVIEVRRYPVSAINAFGGMQYETYILLKLKSQYNKNTGLYSFNRSTLSIGSPIEVQFPNADITGTIIEFSRNPIKKKYVDKIIYLVNQGGYNKDFPYRFDNLEIGDKYFDGEDTVLEILDKQLEKSILSIQNNTNAQIFEREIETTQNIVAKVRVKVEESKDGYFYGIDYKIMQNLYVPFATNNSFFEGFIVRKIE